MSAGSQGVFTQLFISRVWISLSLEFLRAQTSTQCHDSLCVFLPSANSLSFIALNSRFRIVSQIILIFNLSTEWTVDRFESRNFA